MALTLNMYWKPEPGGLELTSATTGTPTVITTNPHYGTNHYRLDASTDTIDFAPFAHNVDDAGTGYVLSWHSALDDWTPASEVFLLRLLDTTGTFTLVTVETDGDIRIDDAAGSTIRTISNPSFTNGTYHWFDLYFQHDASGEIELSIDGTGQGLDTAEDLTDGGTFDEFRFGGQNSIVHDIDSFMFFSGATGSSDAKGDFEVEFDQTALTGAVSDAGLNATAAVDLSSGTWDDTLFADGDTNDISMDDSPHYGTVDTNFISAQNDIIGIGTYFRGLRDGGQAAIHYLGVGNDGQGNSVGLYDDDNDWGPITTSNADWAIFSEVAADLPTTSEEIRYGHGTGGAQNINCVVQAAFLLNILSTAAPAPISLVMAPYTPAMR